ncbi:melanophilin isoform X1 [Monodelphis domestica]|uniref:melanophilin isoform X1 n=1 Tax=Monodelphis domestica TaxID=13616 RepID=UPI0024E2553B|nr:melanophilin isoform X1 [Monodelphis domestica]
MGKKLDLSKLTDEEAKHVWEVVQRDLDLRKKEEERLEELKGKIQKESTKRELLSDQARLNETHCRHCLQPYRFLVNSRRPCVDCHLFTCKNCSSYNRQEQGWVCDSCRLARLLKTGSLEWYYEHVRARFKRFGSDKVMRSLHGRLPGSGGSPEPGGAQLYPVGGAGESEQIAEEDAAGAPHLSREKRLLAVHPFDFDADSDSWAQPGPPPLPPPPARSTPAGAQALSEAPSACVEDAAFPKDASVAQARLAAESQDFPEEPGPSLAEASLPPDAGLEGDSRPDGGALGGDGPHLHPPYFADVDSSEEDAEKAGEAAVRLSKPRSRTSSQESAAPPENQIFEMNQRMLAIECLLARLEERIVVPREESFRPGPRTDADVEEEALKRKLGELTGTVSDQGASSEDDEEGRRGLSPAPSRTQQASQTSAEDNRPLGPEERATHRTPDSALSDLEDRVALTATEVQHARREVSDIESRIAALSAAGLPVKTWEKPKKKSNLQILPLQPTMESSLEEEDPELSGASQVTSGPLVQKRIFNNSLKLQDRADGPFSRKSDYRGSLTQRNPNGKNRRLEHVFAKPVMTHHP